MSAVQRGRQRTTGHAAPRRPANLRGANVRTGLVLASIALVFFGGVIVAKFMGGWTVGMSIVGFAVLVFLAFAIGRNLRRER